MAREIIRLTNRDRFAPMLYSDLYIPSFVNGYSIGMEYIYNWFLSKFPNGFFKTVHVAGKHPFEDFRKFEYGDLVKREKPALAIGSSIQYETEFQDIDMHMVGIDRYMRKTCYDRSFFKDPKHKRYLGIQQEVMNINFTFRCRFSTRAEQIDTFKRMQIAFRIGRTETVDTDMDFHVPYDLMSDLANDEGYLLGEDGRILKPWDFLEYLNAHSQVPFMYKLRYINNKYEFFIRMNNIPLYVDMRNMPDMDDGEQEGQTSNNFHIEWQVSLKLLVPKFYAYYAEQKTTMGIHMKEASVEIYSMRVFDIPEVNDRGWIQFATSNYESDNPNEKYVKEINIKELFVARFDNKVDISLDDLIEDAIQCGISPSSFIDIDVYTNDLMVDRGRIPVSIDWEHRKILLPDKVLNNYFYLAIYTDRLYVNNKILDINGLHPRVKVSKKDDVDRSDTHYDTNAYIEEKGENKL